MAAVPIGSALGMAQGGSKSKTAGREDIKTEHNTPPPLYFGEGSLIIEAFTDKSDWGPNVHANGRRKWSIPPRPDPQLPNQPPTNMFVAHIKVIDGAGEKLYHY